MKRGLSLWWFVLALLTACVPVTPTLPADEGTQPLLVERFAPPHPDWALFDTPTGAAYALGGELYLEDRAGNMAVYTPLLNHTWDNVVLSVRVRQVEGSFNNWMGVLCRYQDDVNYYLFAISADGYYLILRVAGGETVRLAGPVASDSIAQGLNTNLLEVRCEGSTFSMSVNRTFLVSRTDPVLPSGGIGLFADAVGGSGTTTVAFDHLTVTTP